MRSLLKTMIGILPIICLWACETTTPDVDEEEIQVALWVHSDETLILVNGDEITMFDDCAHSVEFDTNVKKISVDSISIDNEMIEYHAILNAGDSLDCSWVHLKMKEYKLEVSTDSLSKGSKDKIFKINLSGSVDSKQLVCKKCLRVLGWSGNNYATMTIDTVYFSPKGSTEYNYVNVDPSLRKPLNGDGFVYHGWDIDNLIINGITHKGLTYNSIYGDGEQIDWIHIRRDGDMFIMKADPNDTGMERSFRVNMSFMFIDFFFSFVGIQVAD